MPVPDSVSESIEMVADELSCATPGFSIYNLPSTRGWVSNAGTLLPLYISNSNCVDRQRWFDNNGSGVASGGGAPAVAAHMESDQSGSKFLNFTGAEQWNSKLECFKRACSF